MTKTRAESSAGAGSWQQIRALKGVRRRRAGVVDVSMQHLAASLAGSPWAHLLTASYSPLTARRAASSAAVRSSSVQARPPSPRLNPETPLLADPPSPSGLSPPPPCALSTANPRSLLRPQHTPADH